MAIAPKLLAEGQLSSSKATIYSVPALTHTFVKFFSIMNTSATPQIVIVYVKAGAVSRIIARVSLLQNESVRIIEKDETLTLEPGDLIEAETTTANVADFIMAGSEQT